MKRLIEIALKILKPINKFIASIGMPMREIDGDFLYELESLIQVGDVLVCKKKYELSNCTIDGKYKHAAIYIGEYGRVKSVVEATTKGVLITDLAAFVMSKDLMRCVRPTFVDSDAKLRAAAFALQRVGSIYDWDFKFDNHAFYCSELVFSSFKSAMGKLPFKTHSIYGFQYITPDDFAYNSAYWQLIIDSEVK